MTGRKPSGNRTGAAFAGRTPEAAERLIRELAVRIVEEKGCFALHGDEDSYRLYDIQLWLYGQA